MSYTKVVVKGTFWFLLFSILSAGVFYLWRLMLTRELSTSDVGLFFAVFSFVNVITNMRELGASSAVVQLVAKYRTQGRWTLLRETLVWLLLWYAFLAAIFIAVVFIAAKPLSAYYFKDIDAVHLIYWLLLMAGFATIYSFLTVAFQGLREIRWYAMMPFAVGIAVLGMTGLLLRRGWGVDAPAAGYAFAVIVVACLAAWQLTRIEGVQKLFVGPVKLKRQTLNSIFKFGLPASIGTAATWVFASVDPLVLTAQGSLTAVALYSVAQPIAMLLRYVPKAITVVMFPVSVELHTLKDRRLNEGVRQVQKYLMLLLLPIGIPIVTLAPQIIAFLFPPEYGAAAQTLQFLTIAQILGAVALVNTYVLLGMGKPRIFAGILVTGAVLNLLLDLILVPSWGVVGVGIANVVAQAGMLIVSLWKLQTTVDYRTPWRAWMKMGIAGVILVLTMDTAKTMFGPGVLGVGAATLIGIVAYGGSIFLLRALTIDELRGLIARVMPR